MNNSSLHRLIIGMVVAFCFGIAILAVMRQPAFADVVMWNVDSDGYWQVASNWSSYPNLPGSADDVTIDRTTAGITVTHSLGSDTINSLTCNEILVLSGGSLTINNAVQINNVFTINGGTVNFNGNSISTVSGVSTFSAGTIGGSGPASFDNLTWTGGGFMTGTGSTEILNGQSMTLSGTGYHLLARTIDNYGTATVIGLSGLNPYSGGSTPTFNNNAGGIFELQSTGGLDPYSSIPGVFNNGGTFRKTTSTGTANVSSYWTFNNSGTVQVQSGTLNVSGAFNNTGTAEVQAGNTMSLSGGGTSTGTFNVFSGATLNFSGGTHSLGGATFNNSGTINFNGATVNFNGGTVTTVPGAVVLSSGTLGVSLTGSATVNFDNLTWTNGTMSGSGTTTVSTSITFSGGGDPLLSGRTLNNAGTATFSSLTYLHGSGALFNNLAGAMVDLQGTNNFVGGGTVNNAGTFRKSVSTSSINIGFAMNNTGTVAVQTGTLNLSAGGTSNGAFNLSSGASLNFSGSTYNLGSATFNNAGTISFNGGTEDFGASATTTVPGTVVLSSGMLGSSGGTVNFDNLTWTNGTMYGYGSGTTTVSTAIIFSGTGDPMLDGCTLNNSGTATFSSTNYLHGSDGAVFNNLAGAMVDLQGSNNFVNDGGTLPVVNNAGTFRKSVSTGNINIGFAMNNTGAVEVQSGGLTFQSTVTQLVGNTLTGGTWKVQTNSSLFLAPGSNIITNQGNVTLDGVGSTFNIVGLANNQGSFSILDGRNFTTVGDLANSGTVSVGSGSDFEVSGDLTGGGTLSVCGILTADSIVQNTLTIGAGATVTIRPISGGPLAAQFQISPVPEPATFTLLLLAGLVLGLWRLRRRDVGIQS